MMAGQQAVPGAPAAVGSGGQTFPVTTQHSMSAPGQQVILLQ